MITTLVGISNFRDTSGHERNVKICIDLSSAGLEKSRFDFLARGQK